MEPCTLKWDPKAFISDGLFSVHKLTILSIVLSIHSAHKNSNQPSVNIKKGWCYFHQLLLFHIIWCENNNKLCEMCTINWYFHTNSLEITTIGVEIFPLKKQRSYNLFHYFLKSSQGPKKLFDISLASWEFLEKSQRKKTRGN